MIYNSLEDLGTVIFAIDICGNSQIWYVVKSQNENVLVEYSGGKFRVIDADALSTHIEFLEHVLAHAKKAYNML